MGQPDSLSISPLLEENEGLWVAWVLVYKRPMVENQSIPTMKNLGRPSTTTWWTHHWHLGWHSIDTKLTFRLTVSKFLFDAYELANNWPTFNQLLIRCRSSVDQVSKEILKEISIEYQSSCWPWVSIGDVDQHCTVDAFSKYNFFCILVCIIIIELFCWMMYEYWESETKPVSAPFNNVQKCKIHSSTNKWIFCYCQSKMFGGTS